MKLSLITLSLLASTSAFAHANVSTYQCNNQDLRTGQIMGDIYGTLFEFDVNFSKKRASFFDFVGNPGQAHVRVKDGTLSQVSSMEFSGVSDGDKMTLMISEDGNSATLSLNEHHFACQKIE